MDGGTSTTYIEQDIDEYIIDLGFSTGTEVIFDILEREPNYDELVDIKGLQQGGLYFVEYITTHEDTALVDDVAYVPNNVVSEAENALNNLQRSNSSRFRSQPILGLAAANLGVFEYANGDDIASVGFSTLAAILLTHYAKNRMGSYRSTRKLDTSLKQYIQAEGSRDIVFKQLDEVREEIEFDNHVLFEK